MGAIPILYPPPVWTDQDLILAHGTIDAYTAGIVERPVVTSRGRKSTDFGAGFYTTSLVAQAHTWAAQIAATVPGANPAVIEIVVSRTSLSGLETLAFARGDSHADDFWSSIHYCRKARPTTAGAAQNPRTTSCIDPLRLSGISV